jgi:hypothetical protein
MLTRDKVNVIKKQQQLIGKKIGRAKLNLKNGINKSICIPLFMSSDSIFKVLLSNDRNVIHMGR